MRILYFAALFAGVDGAAGQQLESQWARLHGAKTLSCTFQTGAGANWVKGSPAIQPEKYSPTGFLVIRSIDIANRSAIYAGSAGEAAVVVSATPTALHFLERTEGGGLVVTTVFAAARGVRHAAVQSRHIATPAEPRPGQFHGLCQVVN
jgi:hypothetical protein